MLVEVRLQSESLPASTAHVRLGVGVRLDMRSQIRFVCEGFGTYRASKWLFSLKKQKINKIINLAFRLLTGMRSDVALQ